MKIPGISIYKYNAMMSNPSRIGFGIEKLRVTKTVTVRALLNPPPLKNKHTHEPPNVQSRFDPLEPPTMLSLNHCEDHAVDFNVIGDTRLGSILLSSK